jgi:hypothetical protein
MMRRMADRTSVSGAGGLIVRQLEVAHLLDLFYRYDPAAAAPDANPSGREEYRSEALQLHTKLSGCKSVAEVESALRQVLSREFGDERQWRGGAARLAAAIWNALNT